MQIKYDIELTINNITNKGQMEIYDDSLILYIDNQARTIMYKNIKFNLVENETLKLTLNDDTTLFIKTVNLDDIHSFIELQRNEEDTYPIDFKTKGQYNLRHYIISFIVIFLVIWFLAGFNTDIYAVLVYLFFSGIFALPAMVIISANSDKKDRATAICPHCHKPLKLQNNFGGVVLAINENQIGKLHCGNCGNMVGMKYNHLYRLTPQNESEFDRQIKPLNQSQQVQQTNVETTNNINENDFDKLEKLKELLDKNLITQEDYENKKQDILNRL